MKELKYLKYYVASFLFLAAFAICFLIAFVKNQLNYFLVCAVLVTLFLVTFSVSTKKMTMKDGYTLIQAYDFFVKCKKNDVYNASGILDRNALSRIQPIVEACDYAKDLNEKQIKRLYSDGWEVDRYIQKLKNKFKK